VRGEVSFPWRNYQGLQTILESGRSIFEEKGVVDSSMTCLWLSLISFMSLMGQVSSSNGGEALPPNDDEQQLSCDGERGGEANEEQEAEEEEEEEEEEEDELLA